MRKIVGLIALGAMAVAAPALAQNDTGREVIRGVLDALLDPAPQQQPQATNIPAQIVARIDDVIAHPRRDGDRARDKYRHPKETLALFQIEPGMTVVDYVPDTGWYARIIAPYLGPSGRYVGMGPNVSAAPDAVRRYWGGQAEKMATNPAGWNLGTAAAPISGFNNDAVPENLVGTVDRVLIFRELHNMLRNGWLHADMLTFRRLLKPGGMIGIEQHRAHPYDPYSATDGSKGYLREQDVIALFDLYGFDLVARSEVNANPKDPANWENGVWTLPPGYRGTGPNDTARRAELDAIGESDRMTMLFRKRP